MSMRSRVAAARVALGGLVALLATIGAGLGAPAGAQSPSQVGATSTSRAVVIVDLGTLGGGVRTSVIELPGSVSGLEALQLAGAEPETITYGALGEAVCKLYGAGDAAVPGQCPGGWVYYRATGGAGGWTQSGQGASSTAVHDGDVEGWRYGGGAPPFRSFCDVAGCAAPPPGTAPPATSPGTAPPAGVSSVGGSSAGGGDPGDGDSASTTTGAPTTTAPAPGGEANRRAAANRGGRGDDATLAAGATGQRGSANGGGSPVGVVVALVVAGALVAAGLLVRRRRAGTG
jgi:hypothetical protein